MVRNNYKVGIVCELKIRKLIVKFLNREADYQELEKLDAWLKKDRNISIFNHFVRTDYLTTVGMAEFDVDKAKENIQRRLKKNERKKRFRAYKRMAIAASIALILGSALYKWHHDDEVDYISNMPPISIEAGSNKAILTLENGNQVALEKGKKYEEGNAKSDGEELIYADNKNTIASDSELNYNYLTIPRGGQFFVLLSDGTEVWLNSDSKLKYPVEFHKGKQRKVELVYGEAYFNVSPSNLHKGSEFHVRTKSQEVGVLGTEFNIKAYNGETEIATTLVEGIIKIHKGGISKILQPNQQSRIRPDKDLIDVEEVDVSQEISWINGVFSFDEESLDKIMDVLSRWYDAEIIFENAEHKRFVFTGKVERTESIEGILHLIKATSGNQVIFEIEDKTITIK